MRLFDTEVQELKYRVLKEIVHLENAGELDKKIAEIPKTIVPGPKSTMRCCIYHERAIVEERVRLATEGMKDGENIVEVIDIACDECPVNRFSVSDACRGCIAHRCSTVCPAGAISFEKQKAVIDQSKCLECGKCMRVCPYNAVTESQRPCIRSCKAKALTLDEQKKAYIDHDKCIDCGSCVYQCPFGAITDRSSIVDVMRTLKASEKGKNFRVYAAIAPSIVSQFSYAKIGQIVAGIRKAGFHSVVEVALGADMVAREEAKELTEKGFLTNSCCPAFVSYVNINFPQLSKHISDNLSPMAEISKYLKKNDPTGKVVFIGPCIAKKAEIRKKEVADYVDAVLTFEELQALLDGMDIHVEVLPEELLDNASGFGRAYARSGGVSAAIAQAVKEARSDFIVKPEICNGLDACKLALLKAQKGCLDANFIEGMACEGGCIGGAACLHHGPKNLRDVDNYANQAYEKTISESLRALV
jgi:[FeFe] hydrogenase (group B1/B3)